METNIQQPLFIIIDPIITYIIIQVLDYNPQWISIAAKDPLRKQRRYHFLTFLSEAFACSEQL